MGMKLLETAAGTIGEVWGLQDNYVYSLVDDIMTAARREI
jgi:hypothetical protein